MTCVVGISQNGIVYMGSDSAGINGSNIVLRQDEKVFKVGNFIFGFCGSFRMGQLLRYYFKPPVPLEGSSDFEYLVTQVVEQIRIIFRSEGYIKRDQFGQDFAGVFLIGYNGNLYMIDQDFQVALSYSNFEAIGSADMAARAVLQATRKDKKLLKNPFNRLKLALEATSFVCTTIAPPFKFLGL